MKKIYLLAAIALTLTVSSCSKKNDKDCYECDIDLTGEYTDAGCYTREEWRGFYVTDRNGNRANCRKK